MPVRRKAHQTQLDATPPSRTRFVTRLGVSVLKVVATIDTPISHHGAARPDVKNSAVLLPARRAIQRAGMNEATIAPASICQSSDGRRTRTDRWMMGTGGAVCQRPHVKSGKSTGAALRPTDCTLSPTTALMAAASSPLK